MGRTLANFRIWWNAAVNAFEASAGPAQQWGKLTDDDQMQLSDQPEQTAFDPGPGRSRASLKTDSDIRTWLSAHGLVDKS